MPRLFPPKDPDEACAQVILVAWKGAPYAASTVTRDKAAAKTRAEKLLRQALDKPDFATLARENSDAAQSRSRGGIIGTYRRQEWPELYETILPTVFSLQVHETAPRLVDSPYGYMIVKRCAVIKARGRHILIRYEGAKKAGKEIKRSREEAKELAFEMYYKVADLGEDFAEVARKHSEDASAKRGGDIGAVGKGRLALPFEMALFNLKPGRFSGVVETEFGFHVIQRLPLTEEK
jgi:peptidyl-prolyl cis-trans isomerase SurA